MPSGVRALRGHFACRFTPLVEHKKSDSLWGKAVAGGLHIDWGIDIRLEGYMFGKR